MNLKKAGWLAFPASFVVIYLSCFINFKMYQVTSELPEGSRDWFERKGFERVKRFELRSRDYALHYFLMMRQLTPEGTRVSFDIV